VAEDLDEAEDGREPPQEAQARALGFARRVGLVAKIGVLGVGRDLVVSDSRSGGAEGLLTNLLAKLIESVSHAAEPATRARHAVGLAYDWPIGAGAQVTSEIGHDIGPVDQRNIAALNSSDSAG
jgi:hypothetical protein